MSKSQDARKETKKAPTKTLKEKRAGKTRQAWRIAVFQSNKRTNGTGIQLPVPFPLHGGRTGKEFRSVRFLLSVPHSPEGTTNAR